MARTLYQKFRDLWKDKPDKTTPVTAEALNHIEQGTYDNSQNMALKEIYDDTAISLGRKSGTTLGKNSCAIGDDAEASGSYSVATGYRTVASGYASSAEGSQSKASASYSHAEGYGTIAAGYAQHVQGKYNVEYSKYAHIVGNGTGSGTRSNAHTLDWDGNAWFAGDVASDEYSLIGLGASLISTATDISDECTVNVSGQTLTIAVPIGGIFMNAPFLGGSYIGLIAFQTFPPYIFRAQISQTYLPNSTTKGFVKLICAQTLQSATFSTAFDGSIQNISVQQTSPRAKGMATLTFALDFPVETSVMNYTICKALPINDLAEKIETLEQRIEELEKEE